MPNRAPSMFEILEHTADIGMRAWGKTREEMFESAALALVSIAVDPGGIEPRQVFPIAASGEDLEALLVNWLSEVLYYVDGQRIVLGRFEVEELEEDRVIGQCWGEPRDARRHPARLIIKGVTYHQLRISRGADQWSAEVYLDI